MDGSTEEFWNTGKAHFNFQNTTMTMREASRIFRLTPEPPKADNINDYIVSAVQSGDGKYFTYFLHHYEPRLNKKVYRFLLNDGLDRYDPDRFLDYKLSCVLAMLECLQKYEPNRDADFLTYAHYFIGNALLDCRRHEEAGSFKSLDEYKAARGIAWLYNNSGKTTKEVITQYASQQNCSEDTATEYLKLARQNRSGVPFYVTAQDEDSEETGEDVTRDDSWNYADILWNSIRAEAVQDAFGKLSYREQTLLEKRNAICMTCGRVSPLHNLETFEDLAIMFEGSSASGAERAYRRALDKMKLQLIDAGILHTVELKRKSQKKKGKKITAAVYEYQADCDGDWGEIQFDFTERTAEIIKLSDWDLMISKPFTRRAIRHILAVQWEECPRKLSLPVVLG